MVKEKRRKVTETIKRSDGIELVLSDITVSSSYNCNHNVSIDGIALEVTMAVRYLLADRERIKTQLADIQEKLNKLG